MLQREMSYRKHVIRQSLNFNVEEVAARNSSTNLISGRFHHRAATTLMKFLFACCLLVRADGRTNRSSPMAATNGKLQCTVGLAIPMEFGLPWCSHMILKGTAPRSLPSAWPDNMLYACSETHPQTIESMLEFVTFLDNKLHLIPGSFSSVLLQSTLRMLFALRFPGTSTYATSILAARPWHSQRTLE